MLSINKLAKDLLFRTKDMEVHEIIKIRMVMVGTPPIIRMAIPPSIKMAMDGLEDDLKRIILTLIKKGEIGITATTRIQPNQGSS